jgi:hypothetical protein
MEHRRFHRVKFAAPSDLVHHGMTYRAHLENISLRGAMLSADEFIMVPRGEICTLTFLLEQDAPSLVLEVEIVHTFFSMVGVRFLSFEADAERRLFELMQSITSEPDQLRQEWQEIAAQTALPA